MQSDSTSDRTSRIEDLPVLVSKFDVALNQLTLLMREIEEHRWDAGVVIMASAGRLEIRGLGVVETPEAILALLLLAAKSLPPVNQAAAMAALEVIIKHSIEVESEKRLWRPEPN